MTNIERAISALTYDEVEILHNGQWQEGNHPADIQNIEAIIRNGNKPKPRSKEMTFTEAKQAEAAKWVRQHSPDAPKPRIIAAALAGKPFPREPLKFG